MPTFFENRAERSFATCCFLLLHYWSSVKEAILYFSGLPFHLVFHIWMSNICDVTKPELLGIVLLNCLKGFVCSPAVSSISHHVTHLYNTNLWEHKDVKGQSKVYQFQHRPWVMATVKAQDGSIPAVCFSCFVCYAQTRAWKLFLLFHSYFINSDFLWFLSCDSFTHCTLLWTTASRCKWKRVALSFIFFTSLLNRPLALLTQLMSVMLITATVWGHVWLML